ncbi:hypothetical protein GCM10009733_006350 [Nonomuraea maheshkhaliensis]|uniref:Uncharacterized protein n=1 Tax=Nonomuraea maheshkhaliensis TaxID=419590 RepID=A0ABN2EQ49_9ACTN
MGLADLAPLLISEGHSPQEADRLLRGSSPLWEKAHADDVAGLAALMSLRHWARAGQQVDPPYKRDAPVLAEAGQKWLRYRMDAVTSRP